MDLVIFEQKKPLVLEVLGNGEFDYLEAANEVFETEFFRFIKAEAILDKLTKTYPSSRKKEEVPLWFNAASNLSMRLHGVHSFHAFPLAVRSGGLLNVLGPKGARKVTYPDTRGTFITNALDANETMGFVQDQVGHSAIKPIVNHYYNRIPRDEDGQKFEEVLKTVQVLSDLEED